MSDLQSVGMTIYVNYIPYVMEESSLVPDLSPAFWTKHSHSKKVSFIFFKHKVTNNFGLSWRGYIIADTDIAWQPEGEMNRATE